jgi:hypothetical protein
MQALRKMQRWDLPGYSWRDSHMYNSEGLRKLVSNLCYGVEDRHKKKKLFAFETAAILNFIINLSLYNLINHLDEFHDPKNIWFDIKIIALC